MKVQISNVKFKKVEKGYILFNIDTGSFHLIPEKGYQVIQYLKKVSGKNEEEIVEKISTSLKLPREELKEFLEGLKKRKIIKITQTHN